MATGSVSFELAPGFRRWLNLTEQEDTAEQLLATLDAERRVVATSTVTVRHHVETSEGFVLELTVTGRTAGGQTFDIPPAWSSPCRTT